MRPIWRRRTILCELAGWLVAALGCGNPELGGDVPGISGTFHTLVASHADGTKRAIYRLKTSEREGYELVFFGPVPRVESGTEVVVDGIVSGDVLEVTELRVTGVGPGRHSGNGPRSNARYDENGALRPLEVGVLLAGTPRTTRDEAKVRLLEDFDGPRRFYAENTYGAWNIAGDAYGPYGINVASCGSRYTEIAVDARNAAKTAGVEIEKYAQTPIVLSGCTSWGGLGEVGTTPSRLAQTPNYGTPHMDSWYADTLSCVIFNQELGHNYGINHSHFCAAGPTALDGGCSGYQEYGDPFTPMANGCYHLNAVEVGFLSAFSPCNVLDVTDGSYEIGPIEKSCVGPQVLRWKDPNSVARAEYIYLEYRRKIGHDAKIREGIYLHYGPEFSDPDTRDWTTKNNGTSAYLVRSRSGGLVAGESWKALGGAEFKVVALGDTAAIEVTGAGNGIARCRDGATAPKKPEACCEVGGCDTGGSGGAGGVGGVGGSAGSGGFGGVAGTGGSGGAVGGSGGTAGGSGGSGGTSGQGGASGDGGDAGSGGASGGSSGEGGSGGGGDAGSAGGGEGGLGGQAGEGGAGGEGAGAGDGGTGAESGSGGSAGVGGSAAGGDAGDAGHGGGGGDIGSGDGGAGPGTYKEVSCDCRLQSARVPGLRVAFLLGAIALGAARFRGRSRRVSPPCRRLHPPRSSHRRSLLFRRDRRFRV